MAATVCASDLYSNGNWQREQSATVAPRAFGGCWWELGLSKQQARQGQVQTSSSKGWGSPRKEVLPKPGRTKPSRSEGPLRKATSELSAIPGEHSLKLSLSVDLAVPENTEPAPQAIPASPWPLQPVSWNTFHQPLLCP